MKKYDLLTPEGTRDLVFGECAALREIGEGLRKIYVSHGYSEVITPGLEFFDVFNNKSRHYSQEILYKLTDGKGRLMVLRPDSTMPIARMVGTRLHSAPLPLKLYYEQTIYRANPKESGRDDEFFQSGVEIIGGDVLRADMEALTIAAEVMETMEVDDYRFEIGDSGIFPLLTSKLELTDARTDELRELMLSKNYPALDAFAESFAGNRYAAALARSARLFGGRDILNEAKSIMPEEAQPVIDRLCSVYDNLSELGICGRMTVDLGLVSKNDDYYTGIVFNGYISGFGMPVLKGGRYDRLLADFGADTPATGFAVSVNALSQALLRRSGDMLVPAPDVMIHSDEGCFAAAVRHCRRLREQGLRVSYTDLDNADKSRSYAKSCGVKRLDIISTDGVASESL